MSLNIFKVLFQSIRIELNLWDEYIYDIASTIRQKQLTLEQDYDNAIAKNPSDTEEIDNYFIDEFNRYHDLFPIFTFNSIILSQFSFFESRLKLICEMIQRKSTSGYKLSDLKGSEMEKCKKYITVEGNINFDSYQENWRKIIDTQKLRNAIVHNAAIISGDTKDTSIINIIKNDDRISYSEEHGEFAIVNAEYLLEFNSTLHSFFETITNDLAENIR